jgi:hypothetical protein
VTCLLSGVPLHLKRLIADDPAVVKSILRALKERRQNLGTDILAMRRMSRVTINLDDLTVEARSDLELALGETTPQTMIDLIRECVVCPTLFWAGRIDKVACDKHAARWRKRKQRRKEKAARATVAGRQHAERKAEAIKGFSPTAVAILNAIAIGGERVFWKIDHAVFGDLEKNPSVKIVPQRHIVRRTINMLVRLGFLEHAERAEDYEDEYTPTPKLIDLW